MVSLKHWFCGVTLRRFCYRLKQSLACNMARIPRLLVYFIAISILQGQQNLLTLKESSIPIGIPLLGSNTLGLLILILAVIYDRFLDKSAPSKVMENSTGGSSGFKATTSSLCNQNRYASSFDRSNMTPSTP